MESLLLELVEGNVEAAGCKLRIEHVLDRLGADRKLHSPCQFDKDLFVSFALADLHCFLLRKHGRWQRQSAAQPVD